MTHFIWVWTFIYLSNWKYVHCTRLLWGGRIYLPICWRIQADMKSSRDCWSNCWSALQKKTFCLAIRDHKSNNRKINGILKYFDGKDIVFLPNLLITTTLLFCLNGIIWLSLTSIRVDPLILILYHNLSAKDSESIQYTAPFFITLRIKKWVAGSLIKFFFKNFSKKI